MKLYIALVFLLCNVVIAHGEDSPIIWGGLDWSADGQYIAVGTTKGVYIHDSTDLSLLKVLDESFSVHAAAWSNNGLKLAYSDWQVNSITLWDLQSQEKTILKVPDENTLSITSLRWSPDDRLVLAGNSAEDNIYVWDVTAQQIIRIIPIDDYLQIYGHVQIDLSPDGQHIVTGTGQNYGTIWNLDTGKLEYMWKRPNFIDTIKWNHDDSLIAGGNSIIHVWDVKTGEIVHTLTTEYGKFMGLSWHPNLDQLAFIHRDGSLPNDFSLDTVIVWDITTDELIELSGIAFANTLHTDKVIEFSPDGSKLASISDEGKIIIWDTVTYEVIAEYDGYRAILD